MQPDERWKRRRRIITDRIAALKSSQQKVADAAGLSKSTISRLLSGERDPETSTLEKLANALRLPLVELVDPGPPDYNQDLGARGASSRYSDEHASGGGREWPAGSGQGDGETGALGVPAAVQTYRGYALGARADPRDRATWRDALSDSRRRVLQVGERTTQRVGPVDTGFAVLVQDSSLSHVNTEQGVIEAGWTLFVDTQHPEVMHEAERVVIAMSRAGELVGGWLDRDPGTEDGGWVIVDAYRRHTVAPDGLIGVVTVEAPPYSTLTWRRNAPPAGNAGHTFVADTRAG